MRPRGPGLDIHGVGRKTIVSFLTKKSLISSLSYKNIFFTIICSGDIWSLSASESFYHFRGGVYLFHNSFPGGRTQIFRPKKAFYVDHHIRKCILFQYQDGARGPPPCPPVATPLYVEQRVIFL